MSRDYSDVCEELGININDVSFIVVDDGEGNVRNLSGSQVHGSSTELVMLEIVLHQAHVWYTTTAKDQALTARFQDFADIADEFELTEEDLING